jgi:DNA gyrase subunit A
MDEFASVRPSGLIAMSLDEGDVLGWARLTSGKDDLIVVTEKGRALRFGEGKVRAMGRQAAGVQGIRLAAGDAVTSTDVVEPDGELLIVTSHGYGKRTPLKEYAAKGRATGGVATIGSKALEHTGKIIAARVVQPSDELTLITANGVALRLKVKQVKQSGRATRGVRLITPQEGDAVASVARISAEELRRAGADLNSDEQPAGADQAQAK